MHGHEVFEIVNLQGRQRRPADAQDVRAIGLKWLRSANEGSKGTGLYYELGGGMLQWDFQTGGKYRTHWFYLEAPQHHFELEHPEFLTLMQRRTLRAMFARFEECLQASPQLLQAIGLNEYLRLEAMFLAMR